MYVIIIEPEHASNVGAVARVMANFGVDKLVLVNPQCNHLDENAVQYAKRATYILKNARVLSSWNDIAQLKLQTLVGTTARVGSDYNLLRAPLTPVQLSECVLQNITEKKNNTKKNTKKNTKNNTNIGLVFGREGHGLFNEEVRQCDLICTIPASTEYGTLNVSHAVAVVLATLFAEQNKFSDKKDLLAKQKKSTTSHITLASATDKQRVLALLAETITKMPFATDERRETQLLVWKRLLAKAALTKRETLVLLGFLRKIQ